MIVLVSGQPPKKAEGDRAICLFTFFCQFLKYRSGPYHRRPYHRGILQCDLKGFNHAGNASTGTAQVMERSSMTNVILEKAESAKIGE